LPKGILRLYPDLDGKVAIVTGSTSGIGKAVAVKLAMQGVRVVVNGTNKKRGGEIVSYIRSFGGEAVFVPANVSDPAHVIGLVNCTVDSFGRLDIACNNAGNEGRGFDTHNYEEDVWDSTIGLNLTGVFLCMKYQLKQLVQQYESTQDRAFNGAIVNMSSIAGLVGGASPAYNASKHGVIGLTKQAALDYAKYNIRVNAVCPAVTKTPMIERFINTDPSVVEKWQSMHPIGRFAESDEVASSVVWLLSSQSSFVTGSSIPVDGGWTAQ